MQSTTSMKAPAVRAGLVVLAVAYFTLGTGSLAVVGLLEPMARAFDVHAADVAQLVTVFAATFAVAAPTFQIAFSRWPRRSILLWGLALLGIGSLAAGLAPTFRWAILARVVMAIGAAAVGPMASTLAATMVAAEEQARALSFVFGGLIFSTVLGVPLATWAGHVLSWQGVFITLAALALACIPAAARFVTDRSAGQPVAARSITSLLGRPPIAWSVLATALQSAAQFASYTLIAVLLTVRYALAPAHVSVALLLFGIGGVSGNLLGGRLGDRVRPILLLTLALAGMGATFIALALAPRNPVAGVALLVAWAVLAMLFQAPQQKRLLALAPGFAGLVLALNSAAMYLGMSLGSWIGAGTFRRWGVEALPVASVFLMAVAMMALGLSRRAPEGAA
jgi:DHA1 family inner membrane transport protein